MNSKDLTKEAPRSPYEKINGFAILARTIDKCRAFLAGTNGDYHFNCPLDRMIFGFKNINAEEFKDFVGTGASDEEIGDWVMNHGDSKTIDEINTWSDHFRTDFSYSTDPNKKDWFAGECNRLGLDPQKTTLFDYLEVDDKDLSLNNFLDFFVIIKLMASLNRGFLQNLVAVFFALLLIFCAYVINFSKPVYATSCSVYDANQVACQGQPGCTWDAISCATYNGDQIVCEAHSGCSYPANGGDCAAFNNVTDCGDHSGVGCTTNTADCAQFSNLADDGAACFSHPECSWDGGSVTCSGTYFSSCSGSYDNGSCAGTHYPQTCSGSFDVTAPIISETTPVTTPTNDTTPAYTFASDEAGTITYGGSCAGGSTNSASVGSNPISFSTLSQGTYADCTITVTDAANNVSNTINVSSFTVDTTAPSNPTTPNLATASDSGSSSTDDITSDNTPSFYVDCNEDGSTITLLEGATSLGTATCSGGTSLVTSSSLFDGTHYISATQTDTAGNVSLESGAMGVVIDTTAPTANGTPNMTEATDSGTSNSDNVTYDTTPTFTGTGGCENGNVVQLYDDGVSSGSSDTCSGGNFSLTTDTLAEGSNAITFKETDTAGNVSSFSSALSVTIDTTSPSISGTPNLATASDSGSSSTDDVTNDNTPTFDVTCENNATVYIKQGGFLRGSATCSSGSASVTTSSFSDGSYSFLSSQTDLAGNGSSDSSTLSVTIDTTAPTTSGAPNMTDATDSGSSNSDDITSDTTPTFTGACTNGTTVQLYDDGTSSGSSATCASSVFSLTTGTLASGSNSITFKETDTAGNTSTASSALVVTIDTTSPTISEVTPIGAGTDTTPDYTFTTDEAGTIIYGGSCTSATTSATSGSNTITLDTLTVGSYSDCTVIVTDASGNASNTLTLTSFTISAPASNTSTTSSSTSNPSGTSRRNISSQSNTTQTNTQTNTTNTLGNKISTTIIPKTFSFTRTLSLNMRGGDIITLQKFLNASGFTVSKTGNGSPGREIQTFGPGTRAALAKFQASVGIKPSIGFFGPITQSYVNKILNSRK